MIAELRKWTINGDFVGLKPTGVARYAREVTIALDSLLADGHPLAADLDLEVLAPREPTDLSLQRIPVRVIPEYRHPRLPQFWVQLQLPLYAKGGLISFCNLAPVFKRRHIVCIHDLHTRVMPESYGLGFRLVHRIVLPLLGRNACRITTVSGFSRQHLVEYGVAPAEKIAVTYNGADHALRWNPRASRLGLEGSKPFVVSLGRSQKYKNTELLWKIARAVDSMGIDILVAGDLDQETARSFSSNQPENIRLLGRVNDDDFAALLSRALCLLFPSRIEGFGLPAAEAMALGCPVVASTAPCLPEVCGEAALYAGPDDVEGWVGAVRRLWLEPELRRVLIAKGLERSQVFAWRRIAEHYLELMASIDKPSGSGGHLPRR